ncbi:hypothetical protein FOCC_FOCC011183 [Frankliniella occidentalis]|nr:hypothetical protein FOCC_FOCC011183 [Frankliniella occidentalis]
MEGVEQGNFEEKEDDILTNSVVRQRKIITSAKETFENASRMLRRKIPQTGHLMTPRRLWIQTVPTQECDVVLMFPSGTADSTLMWLLSRLRAGTPGLVAHVRHHSSSDSYGFYLTAPFNVLLKAAEEIHLPKLLKAEYGGGLKELVQADISSFEGTECEETFFSSQERQTLVLHLLHSLRAGPAEAAASDIFGKLRFIEGQAIVPKCLSAGVISQVFPLHDLPSLQQLQQSWVRAFLSLQPLDAISEYFGVKIAMYFAWLGHYTAALLVPAFVGFMFWVGFSGRSQHAQDVGYVLFSFFNVLWASIYLEAWKRYSAELAYRWGTLDQRDELLVEPRPLYTGVLEVSPVTGRLEPYFPPWKRHVFRWFVSVPIIGLCLAIVFFVMIIILQLQDWWDKRIESYGYPFCLSYLPKILLAIVISVLDEAYYKVACWLNDKENYRLETKYENHLIVKVALFQFVNSFLSLFYIAFYLQDQERLKEQLAALLIARQVIGNLKESAFPYILEQWRLAKLSFDLFGALSPSVENKKPPSLETEHQEGSTSEVDTNNEIYEEGRSNSGNRNVSQAELESALYKYNGTFDDHLELFIQLGYVVLFSSAFPMAATCALINNIIEIRSDAFKLCFIFQRPFGQRVPNIGTWQNAMDVMGFIAVLVNCALIGLSGQVHRMFPEMSTTQTILLIVALEHGMLVMRFLITCAIPDLPKWVAIEMAKVEFARREALRRLSSTVQTPAPESCPSQPSTYIGSLWHRFMVSPAAHGSQDGSEASVDESAISAAASASRTNTPPASRSSISGTSCRDLEDATSRGSTPSTGRTSAAVLVLEEGLVEESRQQTPDKSSPASIGRVSVSSARRSHDWAEGASGRGSLASTPLQDMHPVLSHALPPTPAPSAPRRSREWLGTEAEAAALQHHLTIGPHGGADWVRRLALGLDGPARKTSEPEARRSTDCLASASKDLAASSDSDLLKSAPPWTTAYLKPKFRLSPERDQCFSDSSPTTSSQEVDEPVQSQGAIPKTGQELDPAKKQRVKQSLMKRARTVAMFSLKLKERRAREAQEQSAKKAEQKAMEQMLHPNRQPGGELGCIPLEQLISVEDVAVDLQRRKNHNH